MEPGERPVSEETRMLYLIAALATHTQHELTKKEYRMLKKIPIDQLSKEIRNRMARYETAVKRSDSKNNT